MELIKFCNDNNEVILMAEYKHIVRIVNADLDGAKPIGHALTKIKGVSFMFANMICNLAGVDKTFKTGDLDDKDINKLDQVIRNPAEYGAPEWMFNRRKDPETGEDTHLVSADIKFVQDNDIKSMRKTKSYKGQRHAVGLPLRGQRTKSNFRRNKGKVAGVKKRKGAKTGK